MKGIVIDASIAASWLLTDESDAIAHSVLGQMQAGIPISVPSLWLLEITNLLFTAERRRRLDRSQRNAALGWVEQLSVTILAPPLHTDLKTLQHYAEKHQLTAYDAEYLRVAKEQKLILATLDGNLRAAAKREKVQVIAPD